MVFVGWGIAKVHNSELSGNHMQGIVKIILVNTVATDWCPGSFHRQVISSQLYKVSVGLGIAKLHNSELSRNHMRGLSDYNSSMTRSITWLLMPWLLSSPGHQQPWYWMFWMNRTCLPWGWIQTPQASQCWEITKKNTNIFLWWIAISHDSETEVISWQGSMH